MTKKSSGASQQPAAERLQKVLARSGLGSRRGLEARIRSGDISVNGEVATLGTKVGQGDRIEFEGRAYRLVTGKSDTSRVIMYNKPEGVVSTRSDPEGRRTVFDHLPKVHGGRWIAIGRLDINTTGLLLLTTDGELANAMMHPSYGVDREYACRVHGEVTGEMLRKLREGVELEDGPAQFSDIVESGGTGENRWFHVTLLEGRNREVRRLWEAVGVRVSRLKRVRYGAVFMPSRMKVGRWEELSPADVQVLREDVGLPPGAGGQLTLKPIANPNR
ncbi:MAG: pseudouridine synthase [Xanthomonadales bacterium]|nr:pseudouridine synthase [Xanthomonadales bacterium]